jgi:hypothetical protein
MLYDIVSGRSINELKYVIRERLESGWKLQGGVAVEICQYATFYHQAMTLETPVHEARLPNWGPGVALNATNKLSVN